MADDTLSVAQLQQTIEASGAQWEAGLTSISELSDEEQRLRLGYVPGPDEQPLEVREQVALANLQAARAAVAGRRRGGRQ